MDQPQAFDALCTRTPAAQALALKLVTETDLLRLKVIARVHARGLPPEISWSDLLQEAFARVLDGSRQQPDGLPIVVFLAGVMRSIKAAYWRRARREARQLPRLLATLEAVDAQGDEPYDPAPNPERRAIAMQELAMIDQLFANDAQARRIIAGLAEERSPDEIRASYDMSKTDYDSTRKRMRRVLLREGLRLRQP
jgi:RNA polymerase sigma-70 factor (ECF subfamily)